jgi:hypothetical protein
MRYNPRIRHPEAERVLTLLDVAGIYAGGRDTNANLTSCRTRVGHLANHQNLARRSLLLVPSCPHLKTSFLRKDLFVDLGSLMQVAAGLAGIAVVARYLAPA